jgi:fatty acid amide hydrolase
MATSQPTLPTNQTLDLGAATLAKHLASGELSALEVVEAHIEQIERVNPGLNAVIVQRYDQARAEARQADARRLRGDQVGELHGVPITIKECLDLVGTPSTFGLVSRKQQQATKDEVHVACMRQAGAIVLGKTNVAQLLAFVETDNPVYGRTNNPHNPERTCGGSSGGEGAIIAAGGSPLGLGTDIGGSVRIPAAFCGITSIKPTAGRMPDTGRASFAFGQQAIQSQVGVLGKKVADISLGLLVANRANPANIPLGNPNHVDLSKLRIAFYQNDQTLTPCPAARRAVREAAARLRTMGAQVTEWQPPAVPDAYHLFYRIMTADGGAHIRKLTHNQAADPRVAQLAQLTGLSRPMVGLVTGLLSLAGQHKTAAIGRNFGYRDTNNYWELVEAQHDYRERFAHALNQADGGPFDLILAPAFALPALTHGTAKDLGTAGAYTLLYNLLGYPAGVVPFTRVLPHEETERPASADIVEKTAALVEKGSAGLPIGVQVIARPWQEHLALAAMQALE